MFKTQSYNTQSQTHVTIHLVLLTLDPNVMSRIQSISSCFILSFWANALYAAFVLPLYDCCLVS